MARPLGSHCPLNGGARDVDRVWSRAVHVETEPHVIFAREEDTVGPAGTDEWMAFVTDSEDNLVGLVEHRPRR